MPKAIVVLVKFLDDADGWGVGSVVVNGRGASFPAPFSFTTPDFSTPVIIIT